MEMHKGQVELGQKRFRSENGGAQMSTMIVHRGVGIYRNSRTTIYNTQKKG
jgi:hypothetical protein